MRDIVIIGAGLAGLTAAITASERKADVFVLEAESVPGGLTNSSYGYMSAVDPRILKSSELSIDSEDHFKITMASGGGRGNQELVEALTYDAPSIIVWMETHGVKFLPELFLTSRSFYPIEHLPETLRGSGYIEPLFLEAKRLKVDFEFNAPVIKITKEKKGYTVSYIKNGVKRKVQSSKVIVAAGTFAQERRRLLLEDRRMKEALICAPSRNYPSGLTLLEEVGVQSIHLAYSFKRIVQVGKEELPAFFRNPVNIIAVNKQGKRFLQEDEREANFAEEALNRNVARFFYIGTPNWMAKDLEIEALNVSQLARKFGINEENLIETITQYNKIALGQFEDPLGRRPVTIKTLDPTNLIAIEANIQMLTTTGGGLINTKGEAISRHGKVIEGLYIAGDSAGGIHGRSSRFGNMLLAAAFFARAAALNATKSLNIEKLN